MPRHLSRIRPPLAALSTVFLLTSLAQASPAAAQEYHETGPVRVFSFGRPRIGVTVGIKADKDADKLGARIEGVTPDGPADKAGLKEGDIITRFNGVALGGLKGDDEDESGPGQKLIDLARKLEAGDTVQVEYRRGSDSRKATLVAQDLGGMAMRSFRFNAPDMRMELPRMEGRMFEGGPDGAFRVLVDGNGLGLDLTDLNPDLGEYFGAREGVLVLKTPEDKDSPFRAGDVIVAIDGRAPKSESQVRRILGSYDPGDTVKIDILRKQKKMTLSWKVPDHGGMMWRTPRAPRPPRTPAPERS